MYRGALALILLGIVCTTPAAAEGMEDFDASDVTWAHAVNSRAMLEKELNGSVDFLEADVSLGLVQGSQFGTFIPIMAHPPVSTSDISLEDWLEAVSGSGKGVKLDFKELQVVEPSLVILQKIAPKLNSSSLWLNADILPGPIHASGVPVRADMFLYLCHQFLPEAATAVLSLGWTTEWYPTYPHEGYGWGHVRQMADAVRCFDFGGDPPGVTFPVRGVFAARSSRQLRWLLGVVEGSSLTVWTSVTDPLEVDDLLAIRRSFPKDKVYYDLPPSLHDAFTKAKDQASHDGTLGGVEHWMTLKRGPEGTTSQCSSNTYITSDTVVFGKGMYTTVLLKKLLVAEDGKRDFRIRGQIEFFDDEQTGRRKTGNRVSIVLVDVSLFSRSNVTLDLNGSDSDVLWSAVNASHLYSFEETDKCRVFSLDSGADNPFQAWTVHCDDLGSTRSFEEITADGVPEVPRSRRLVLPSGPAMIGFAAAGEGHAVLSNLKIEEVERTKRPAVSGARGLLGLSVWVLSAAVVLSFLGRRFLT